MDEETIIDDQDELINPNRPRLRYIDYYMRPNCFQLSKRYTLVILIHMGFFIIFAMRSDLCFFDNEVFLEMYNDTENDTARTFHKIYDIEYDMNASFFLAYLLVQIPAAILSYKFPAQRVFGICILASSIMAIVQAFTLNWVTFEFGYAAFFQGLVQSASIPAVHGILYNWVTPTERATLSTLAYSGSFTGVCFGVAFSSLTCKLFEAEHLFAIYGIAGIIWFLVWIWLVFERPEVHPTIADSEFEYLKRHIHVPKIKPPIPWRKIFSSSPCWALFVIYLCRSFNPYYLFQADYTQFNYVLFHMTAVGLEIPSAIMTIAVPATGYLADQISSKTSLSITNIRKYYICGGLFFEILTYIPGLLLEEDSIPYLINNRVMDIIFYSFTISGYYVNHLDIAPIYACVTMCIGNLFGSLLGAFMSFGGGSHKTFGNKYIFYYMTGFHLFGIIFYGIWGSGEVQPWAKTKEDENQHEQNSTTSRQNSVENPK
ncbi:vesicular glutamate transporter 1-like [Chrysoperla carnea]|uniref:vesicular glutamate transporter 1-like n=1 Tax=Chrysoperla carnea TaxID=189513 RepID=UPI001D066939|nr:vesicular glutamate transporter 1-like [Chrysoperla carnea]